MINFYCINLNFILFNFKKNFIISYIIKTLFNKFNKSFLFTFCNHVYSKIFLKVGLGFRKKCSRSTSIYNMFVGRRKWASFILQPNSYFFNVRRKNIFLFCNSKKKLYENIVKIKYMRRETVYKVKGIMSLNRIRFKKRISRSIVFARRVKFRKMKLKLTKKQKQKRK